MELYGFENRSRLPGERFGLLLVGFPPIGLALPGLLAPAGGDDAAGPAEPQEQAYPYAGEAQKFALRHFNEIPEGGLDDLAGYLEGKKSSIDGSWKKEVVEIRHPQNWNIDIPGAKPTDTLPFDTFPRFLQETLETAKSLEVQRKIPKSAYVKQGDKVSLDPKYQSVWEGINKKWDKIFLGISEARQLVLTADRDDSGTLMGNEWNHIPHDKQVLVKDYLALLKVAAKGFEKLDGFEKAKGDHFQQTWVQYMLRERLGFLTSLVEGAESGQLPRGVVQAVQGDPQKLQALVKAANEKKKELEAIFLKLKNRQMSGEQAMAELREFDDSTVLGDLSGGGNGENDKFGKITWAHVALGAAGGVLLWELPVGKIFSVGAQFVLPIPMPQFVRNFGFRSFFADGPAGRWWRGRRATAAQRSYWETVGRVPPEGGPIAGQKIELRPVRGQPGFFEAVVDGQRVRFQEVTTDGAPVPAGDPTAEPTTSGESAPEPATSTSGGRPAGVSRAKWIRLRVVEGAKHLWRSGLLRHMGASLAYVGGAEGAHWLIDRSDFQHKGWAHVGVDVGMTTAVGQHFLRSGAPISDLARGGLVFWGWRKGTDDSIRLLVGAVSKGRTEIADHPGFKIAEDVGALGLTGWAVAARNAARTAGPTVASRAAGWILGAGYIMVAHEAADFTLGQPFLLGPNWLSPWDAHEADLPEKMYKGARDEAIKRLKATPSFKKLVGKVIGRRTAIGEPELYILYDKKGEDLAELHVPLYAKLNKEGEIEKFVLVGQGGEKLIVDEDGDRNFDNFPISMFAERPKFGVLEPKDKKGEGTLTVEEQAYEKFKSSMVKWIQPEHRLKELSNGGTGSWIKAQYQQEIAQKEKGVPSIADLKGMTYEEMYFRTIQRYYERYQKTNERIKRQEGSLSQGREKVTADLKKRVEGSRSFIQWLTEQRTKKPEETAAAPATPTATPGQPAKPSGKPKPVAPAKPAAAPAKKERGRGF